MCRYSSSKGLPAAGWISSCRMAMRSSSKTSCFLSATIRNAGRPDPVPVPRAGIPASVRRSRKPVAPRARRQHHAAFRHADVFGPHDLVGLALLQESVHVDSRAVRERVGADHRLVRRNLRCPACRPPAGWCGKQLARVDAGVHAEVVRARAQRHHHLFQRRVAGPFADSVDGALHLARAVQHAVQRIGHRHARDRRGSAR